MKRYKYLNLAREQKQAIEYVINDDTNYDWCSRNGSHRLGKVPRRVGNRWTNRDHPNYSIVKIDLNAEKSL